MHEKPIVITVHLGIGEHGELRKQALLAMAALAGHTYDGNASIGRWLVAQADKWLERIYEQIKEQKGKNCE